MLPRTSPIFQNAAVMVCVLLFPLSITFGQQPAVPPGGPPATQPATPLLSPGQLDNLVAPVALYPDPLLGQVLAASTYPLEIVQAQQWYGQNSQLQGAQLMDAARQQNWDASIQALVAFPDVLHLLGSDIRWTTDLGNAFLAQPADVMAAVQRMRARAKGNGKLATTPQQVVTTDTQNSQSAIEIEPANPQLMDVPVYQPDYVWGPPEFGAYPDLWYPPGYGYGFGFEPGIYADWFFPGWLGWGGWGWGCGWFGNGLFVNVGFFHRYGFHGGFQGGGRGERTAWQHDPNRAVAGHSSGFASNGRNSGQLNANRELSNRGSAVAGANRSGWQRFSGSQTAASGYARGYRPAAPGAGSQGYRVPAQGYRSAPSYSRSYAPSYSAPRYSAPRSYSVPRPSYSAPRSFGGGSRSSGFSGGQSFGGGSRSSGFSGGHSGGGGGGRRR